MKKIKKSYFQCSLIILIWFEFITTYYQFPNGSFFKLILNFSIYVSLCSIPFVNFKKLKEHLSGKTLNVYILILGYGIINIIRDLDTDELVSLFGNTYYGPSFLVPIFLLWSTKQDVLYWLNRISIISMKVGIIVSPIFFYLGLKTPFVLFYPTFFILLNYDYVNKTNKIWIFFSLIVGTLVNLQWESRSGLIRIILCVLIFIYMQLNLRLGYKLVVMAMLAMPIYGLSIGFTSGESIFDKFADNDSDLTNDSRTFLYSEVYLDLTKNQRMIFGKGPVGTYFSQYFYDWNGIGGDSSKRHNVEVGVLHYLLKGGVIYLFLIFTAVILAIRNAFQKSKNKYVHSLGLLLGSFLLVSFIENIPSYSFYFGIVWIIIGICSSNKIKQLNDSQIKYLIQNKTRNNKFFELPNNLV